MGLKTGPSINIIIGPEYCTRTKRQDGRMEGLIDSDMDLKPKSSPPKSARQCSSSILAIRNISCCWDVSFFRASDLAFMSIPGILITRSQCSPARPQLLFQRVRRLMAMMDLGHPSTCKWGHQLKMSPFSSQLPATRPGRYFHLAALPQTPQTARLPEEGCSNPTNQLVGSRTM